MFWMNDSIDNGLKKRHTKKLSIFSMEKWIKKNGRFVEILQRSSDPVKLFKIMIYLTHRRRKKKKRNQIL